MVDCFNFRVCLLGVISETNLQEILHVISCNFQIKDKDVKIPYFS